MKERKDEELDEMYESVSKDVKKEMCKKDLVKRYKAMYEEGGVKNLKVSGGEVDKEDEEKKRMKDMGYKVRMKRNGGKVRLK
ncbi:NTF2-like N-terminal transpeptidase domain-containing protein, partial [Bacillus subtilis]|uniref:NTF2-like N-terminal transpeptidase domain-containing protein n=1 Tax=Bacillus subtilis TaxID=1423 RepID=UPI002576CF40